MIEFDLEAVAVVAVVCDPAQRGVALCADSDVFVAFAVNDNRAGGVFLAFAVLDEAVPIVRNDVNGVYIRRVEKP